MVKQCRNCHATFTIYKSLVATDEQLTCERCAELYRKNEDKDEQHRRDLKMVETTEVLRVNREIAKKALESQRDVLKKQAEEKAKVCIAEEKRKAKEAESQQKIRVAEEVTKQKEIQLQIAQINRQNKEDDVKLKLKEIELKIAEQHRMEAETKAKVKEKEEERRQSKAQLKCVQTLSKTFRNRPIGPQEQQTFAQISKNGSFGKEMDQCEKIKFCGRKKAPWTALHCTISSS